MEDFSEKTLVQVATLPPYSTLLFRQRQWSCQLSAEMLARLL